MMRQDENKQNARNTNKMLKSMLVFLYIVLLFSWKSFSALPWRKCSTWCVKMLAHEKRFLHLIHVS